MYGDADRRGGIGRKNVRMKVVFRDDVALNAAATLNASEEGMLISSDVQLDPGTEITLFPLLDELDVGLAELKGMVVRSYEDIMVSAFASDRFQMGIKLSVDEKQKVALHKFLDMHRN